MRFLKTYNRFCKYLATCKHGLSVALGVNCFQQLKNNALPVFVSTKPCCGNQSRTNFKTTTETFHWWFKKDFSLEYSRLVSSKLPSLSCGTHFTVNHPLCCNRSLWIAVNIMRHSETRKSRYQRRRTVKMHSFLSYLRTRAYQSFGAIIFLTFAFNARLNNVDPCPPLWNQRKY